jgi:4-oxalomesaconate tautomerase
MWMRGGTSKGAYFVRDDLPPGADERDELLLRIVGSPDPRQIDGIGGAHPLTTKVAIIAASARPDVDVDYLFLQPSVDEPIVSDAQNCGNLLAGVGPFAVERGLMAASPAATEMTVRILMENTDSVATATFPIDDGLPRYDGSQAISGVPGTGAPIRLDFEDVAGGTCGALLPSGAVCDEIAGVRCTLIDCGMPVVVMLARDVGVRGDESCAELEANEQLRGMLEKIRVDAAARMGLGDVSSSMVPKLTLVSPPNAGGSLSTRSFIPHRCHDAIGVLAGVTVAAAALIEGTPASEALGDVANGVVVLEHPTGAFEAVVDVTGSGVDTVVERAGIIRTARKLMDGTVFPGPRR